MAVTKIRCSQGGEWKTKDQYSQSALRKFQKKVGMGIATPAESSIACVEHSRGTKAPEMQCQGPCDKWRELHFFSKSTRRNGINWCKDCVDWGTRMEVGEALPPPGEKPIKGEFDTIKTTAAQYMVEDDYEHGIPVQASASGASINLTDDDYEVFNLLPPGSETGTVAESAAGPESTISPESINTSQPLSVAPTSKRMVPVAQAPHWFLGSLGTDISASSPSITPTTPTTLDTLDEAMTELSISASVSQSQSQTMTTSVNTNTTGLPGQRGPVSFNAWGPEGEQMRRVKQPTIATEESGWKTVTRTSKGPRVVTARPPAPKEQVRKGGWVKTNNRRTVPTLPDYLKYDTFDGEGDYTGDSPEEN